jgi:ABC-type lipoprotein release transport system permease subunit
MPLLVEGSVVGLIGFLLGCLVAYGASLRRRGDSDWS